MHGIFKPDENAAGRAVHIARLRNPAAARASLPVVIYPVHPAAAAR
jgi:hypothetical protein